MTSESRIISAQCRTSFYAFSAHLCVSCLLVPSFSKGFLLGFVLIFVILMIAARLCRIDGGEEEGERARRKHELEMGEVCNVFVRGHGVRGLVAEQVGEFDEEGDDLVESFEIFALRDEKMQEIATWRRTLDVALELFRTGRVEEHFDLHFAELRRGEMREIFALKPGFEIEPVRPIILCFMDGITAAYKSHGVVLICPTAFDGICARVHPIDGEFDSEVVVAENFA